MRKFTYLMPKTLDEAISMHVSYDGRARYIAGGTDVLVKLKEGKIGPDYLVSLRHIIGQDRPFLNTETGELYIGAFMTHRSIERSSIVQHRYPILHDAVKNIGSVQIRNVATIGGNLVNAVPSADGAIPLIALDGKAHIYGPKGYRLIDLARFFLGPGQCEIQGAEILTEIIIPRLAPRTGGAYITKARICLGVAAPTPFRALAAESYLRGKSVTEDSLAEAGKIAAGESRVRDSIRGVAWYRREMVGVLVKRMGLLALERAKGN